MAETRALSPVKPMEKEGALCAFLIRIGQNQSALPPQPCIVDLGQAPELLLGRAEETRLSHERGSRALLTIDDSWVSERHARILMTLDAGKQAFLLEDLGSTNGCFVNGERVLRHALAHGDILETGQTFWKLHLQSVENPDELLALAYDGGEILPTSSFSLTVLRELWSVRRVARGEIPVIICGESGTGKEIFAAEIHQLSGRAGRFVAVNCAAIPQTLIESELFGHRKGAFTGAIADKRGMIEEAQSGTLLLDEVGDMPVTAQSKLLRVLQDRMLTRVGETTSRHIDVRFVAATHRDLRQMVASEVFRGDLFARLNGFAVYLPPLRERKEDLGILLSALLRRHAGGCADEIAVSPDVFRALLLYDWPFNIRELEKTLIAALALSGGRGPLEPWHLPASLRRATPAPAPAPAEATAAGDGELEDDEGERPFDPSGTFSGPRPWKQRGWKVDDDQLRPRLLAALTAHAGNISAVARELSTTRTQVHRWLRRLGLDPGQFKGS